MFLYDIIKNNENLINIFNNISYNYKIIFNFVIVFNCVIINIVNVTYVLLMIHFKFHMVLSYMARKVRHLPSIKLLQVRFKNCIRFMHYEMLQI